MLVLDAYFYSWALQPCDVTSRLYLPKKLVHFDGLVEETIILILVKGCLSQIPRGLGQLTPLIADFFVSLA
jgi:hypothetical protein